MKFCTKCGKELSDEAVICTGCGCPVETVAKAQVKEVSYDDCVKGAMTANIMSLVVIALGVVCWLFVNMWVGAILCLVAEVIALSTNSKVQKAFKQNGLTGNTKEVKEKRKAIMKELRAKSPAYKFSMVLGIIALVLLIVFIIPA